jgi:hypothetical protein
MRPRCHGTVAGALVQRKPDGTTFEQTVSNLRNFDVVCQMKTLGMRSSAGLQDVLVGTQNDNNCVWERTLTKNGDGFYEVGASSTKVLHKQVSLGKIWPAAKWLRPGYLARYGNDFNAWLELYPGSDALWAGQNTQLSCSQILMTTTNIGWICHDPQTGHFLYTDSQTYIHRVKGMESYTARARAAADTGFLY